MLRLPDCSVNTVSITDKLNKCKIDRKSLLVTTLKHGSSMGISSLYLCGNTDEYLMTL